MATGGVEEEQTNSHKLLRISDIAKEPLELLLPIDGYEDMPLVSLEEAVEKLVHILPRIQTYAYIAKERCKKPADELTQDESAAIMLYTMGWKPYDKCLYVVLNATLREKDREKLTPWFLYLRLLLNALFRLPSISKTVFRGVKLDLTEQYVMNNTIIWWGFSSCTTRMNVLQTETFLGTIGVRTMFTIECLNGKDIYKHSYYESEDEILLLPATYFKVTGSLNQGDLHLIHLQEIKPPFQLLQPISTSLKTKVISRIGNNTQWKQHGNTVAGGNGEGYQLNQLTSPRSLSIDNAHQSIYIADYRNHRIVEWKLHGKSGQVIVYGNGEENQINQLYRPTNVIVDAKNNSLIIAERNNRRVVEWSRQNGTKNGQILISGIYCYGLTIDNNGHIYVSDTEKNEVRRWKRGEINNIIVAGGNGKGNELDQFDYPTYIFVDQNDSLYISDRNNNRVMKWAKNAKEGVIVAGGQGRGSQLTQLSKPNGITVDHLDNVYVADSDNHRIICWPKGAKQGKIIVGGNNFGRQSNQLNWPIDLSFDREDNLYVVDHDNHRVQKFEIDKY